MSEPKRPGEAYEPTESEKELVLRRLNAGDQGKADSEEYLARLEKRLSSKQPVPR